jgi:F-type H+-transporting ATPase subunit b
MRAVKLAALAAALGSLLFLAEARAARADQPQPSGTEVAAEAEAREHGGGEEHESEFNWAYGFLGEKEGVEPSLLYRPKGMPSPFLANLVNAGILYTILIVAGRKPLADGLRKRKERLVAAIDEATRMKEEAAKRLAEYEDKIKHLDAEVERIRAEMREAAEIERRHILSEAKERRERMERDAKLLIEQEVKAAREALMRETVAAAVKSAEDILQKQLSAADQDRLATDYLGLIQKMPVLSVGGRS